MSEKLKTIVVDDHAFFRKTLSDYLDHMGTVDVIAEAGNGAEAVRLAEKMGPHTVVMDINMPEMDGVSACEMIKKANSGIRVVLYTMYDIGVYSKTGMTAADRCVSKDRLFEELPEILKNKDDRT